MKRTIKILTLLLIAALMLSAASLYALQSGAPAAGQDQKKDQPAPSGQGKMPPPDQGEQQARMLDRLTKELSLTADQQTKVKEIITKQADQMKALREDQSMSREDRRAKMADIRQSGEKAINDILTPEQQKKYADLREQMRQEMQNRRQGGDQPKGPGL